MATYSLACVQTVESPLQLKHFDRIMRQKSSSDPWISSKDLSVVNPRNIATISGESSPGFSSVIITESLPTPCCAAGEHFLTSNDKGFLSRSLSINSIVNVDINDISGDAEMLATTYSLRRCKTMVLRPYTWLLLLIGWRAFGKERVLNYPRFWKILNIAYPILVIVLIWYSNIMQAITCHGKLNPKTDTLPVTTTPRAITTTTWYFYENTHTTHVTTNVMECNHILTTYVLPNILHFLAFIYGFHYFRIQENEQLYSLMERVFVQAQTTTGVQELLIRNSRLFLLAAFVWLLAHIGLEILYFVAFELEFSSFVLYLNVASPSLQYFLITTRFLGLIMAQCVNIAVTVNYCTQCEMLIMHIRSLCLHLHEKTMEIKDAMHEVLGIKEFISLLNGTLGKMTGLCVLGFLELCLIGIGLLIFNQVQKATVWGYRIMFVVMWLMAILFPLIQAARVSKTGRKLRHISLEMRVFGYQHAPQLELDSFVLFINTAVLRAKLFGIGIKPGSVVLSLIVVSLVILIVIITDTVPISTYWTFL